MSSAFVLSVMPPAPPASAAKMRPIPAAAEDSIGDFQKYPGARLLLVCAACSWCRPYNPERVIARLRELRTGGYATRPRGLRPPGRLELPGLLPDALADAVRLAARPRRARGSPPRQPLPQLTLRPCGVGADITGL
ncbi:hypothetical protein LRS10_10815 [Phenylobacterium sp. J426]|uniref:hypothetical protein n=1 Tax=Phenylobacterium sp. J426 TaxID=2898439 RepID=UPI002151F032|nr:hypothetical protein [Phenylobacterium sp. J426]MCR5874615.1 hypothetical protein [Phenylobacterium sp. J426]